ncbi:hypothetical protein D3C86_1656190 [compost metagenome]
MVADHKVRGVEPQLGSTAYFPTGRQAQGEDQFDDFSPGFGDPHHHLGSMIAVSAFEHQLEQGEHHQGADQHQGVE